MGSLTRLYAKVVKKYNVDPIDIYPMVEEDEIVHMEFNEDGSIVEKKKFVEEPKIKSLDSDDDNQTIECPGTPGTNQAGTVVKEPTIRSLDSDDSDDESEECPGTTNQAETTDTTSTERLNKHGIPMTDKVEQGNRDALDSMKTFDTKTMLNITWELPEGMQSESTAAEQEVLLYEATTIAAERQSKHQENARFFKWFFPFSVVLIAVILAAAI